MVPPDEAEDTQLEVRRGERKVLAVWGDALFFDIWEKWGRHIWEKRGCWDFFTWGDCEGGGPRLELGERVHVRLRLVTERDPLWKRVRRFRSPVFDHSFGIEKKK